VPIGVRLTDAMNEDVATVWLGEIVGTEGALDPNSRELFAIARVADPFSRKSNEKRSPLRIGQPVRAEIDGKILKDVFVVPRSSVRKLNRIALIEPDAEDKDKLVLRRVEIDPIWSGLDEVIVRDPEIPDHAQLATTRMVYAPEGTPVEILETPEPEEDEAIAGSSEGDEA
jgi:hypothetical protein